MQLCETEIPWPPWVLRSLQAVMWVCRENIHVYPFSDTAMLVEG